MPLDACIPLDRCMPLDTSLRCVILLNTGFKITSIQVLTEENQILLGGGFYNFLPDD